MSFNTYILYYYQLCNNCQLYKVYLCTTIKDYKSAVLLNFIIVINHYNIILCGKLSILFVIIRLMICFLSVKVHAKHEEKSDSKSVYREYNREFLLPKGTNPEAIKSSLSKDGVLTVEAPLPALGGPDKLIPISHH